VKETSVTVPAQYLRPIAELLRSSGASVEEWLARNELSTADLAQPALTLPVRTFRNLVADGFALAREPALGLLVGARLVASTHGIVGYAALSSGTLREALGIFERFTSLRTSRLAIDHEERRGRVFVRFRELEPLGDAQRPVHEAIVLSVKNLLDAISMGACQVREVAFPFPKPEYAALAEELFGCRVLYDQSWSGLTLPAEVVDVPLKLSDPRAFQEAALICQRELDKLAASTSLTARVRRLLFESANGFPSLPTAARLLHLAPRTMHRRLVEEGASYREVLEDVRHTLALEHLRAGRFSVKEIAYLLGYSDLANFRRAFKQWEGVPPSAFRR
jgi:AraC-like DNA-binding protein